LIVVLLVWCANVTGCGGEPHERYVPEADIARGALEAALTAWKNGEPLRTVTSFETQIDVFDERWRNGQELQSFEIVEDLPADPHRTFRVRMRFAGNAQDEDNTYLVMGVDPILVFRSEDYKRATGM
jgi:hypothetical protein